MPKLNCVSLDATFSPPRHEIDNQVTKLMGYEPLTKYVVLLVMAIQLTTAYLLMDTHPLNWKFVLAAYVIGGTANQNLFLAVGRPSLYYILHIYPLLHLTYLPEHTNPRLTCFSVPVPFADPRDYTQSSIQEYHSKSSVRNASKSTHRSTLRYDVQEIPHGTS